MENQFVTLNYQNKLLAFMVRPKYTDQRDGRCIDIQVLKEIYGENVYRLTPEMFQNGSGIMIDLGANIGAVGVMAKALGAKEVISVEPNADNIKSLLFNFQENGYQTTLVTRAVSDISGKTISINDDAGNSKTNSEGTGQSVETITLAELIGDQQIDVLKIDVEGDEWRILLSTPIEKLKQIRQITLEFHEIDADTFGRTTALLSQGFVVETIGSHERGGFINARRY